MQDAKFPLALTFRVKDGGGSQAEAADAKVKYSQLDKFVGKVG